MNDFSQFNQSLFLNFDDSVVTDLDIDFQSLSNLVTSITADGDDSPQANEKSNDETLRVLQQQKDANEEVSNLIQNLENLAEPLFKLVFQQFDELGNPLSQEEQLNLMAEKNSETLKKALQPKVKATPKRYSSSKK